MRGLEDFERLVGFRLAFGVAVVAGELGLNGGDGGVHALATFGLDCSGLEGGEGGGERGREERGRSECEEGEDAGELHGRCVAWMFAGFGGVLFGRKYVPMKKGMVLNV